MDEYTPRFMLPLLQVGQAQKEATHNEALAMVDLIAGAAVVDVGVNAPPAVADEGACWIVGTAPTGAWADRANALAGWTAQGWRFVAPREGTTVWDVARGQSARFLSGAWVRGTLAGARVVLNGKQVVGERQPAIAAPTGGTTADAAARTAIAAILTAMRAHGLIAE